MHLSSPASLADPPELDEAGNPLQRDRLLSLTFIGLLLTQFLGATNDNILRWLVIGIGKQYVDSGKVTLDVSTVLAIGSACFLLPYLLLAAPAGYLADRFSKRSVIVWCKVAEIAIMTIAGSGDLDRQRVFDVPGRRADRFAGGVVRPRQARQHSRNAATKQNLVRQWLARLDDGRRGRTWHGHRQLAFLGAKSLGRLGQERWWLSALVLIGMAAAGWLTSLMIMRLKAAAPERTFPWDMATQTIHDLKVLAHDRALLRVALGIMFFWSLGLLVQLNIDQFGFEHGFEDQRQVSALLASLIVGVGLGSVLAGLWSGGKVELGIVPLGAGGLALSAFCCLPSKASWSTPARNTRAATSPPARCW